MSDIGVDPEGLDEFINDVDEDEIRKLQLRREKINDIRSQMQTAKDMKNIDWANCLLKHSAEELMCLQSVIMEEITDNPRASNITAISELSNVLRETVKNVMDIEQQENYVSLQKQKVELRRQELAGGLDDVISGEGRTLGTNQEVLMLLKNGIDPANKKEEK
jgi:hypothetical protein